MPDDREPVPAWAAIAMSDQARWAGRWAGCSDILARLVRRLPEDADTRAALDGYQHLRDEFERPLVVMPAATLAETATEEPSS